jgi:hypothetical protein
VWTWRCPGNSKARSDRRASATSPGLTNTTPSSITPARSLSSLKAHTALHRTRAHRRHPATQVTGDRRVPRPDAFGRLAHRSQARVVASAATAAPAADNPPPLRGRHRRALSADPLADHLCCSPPFARRFGRSTAVGSRWLRSPKYPGPIQVPGGLGPLLRRQLGDAQDGWRRGVSRPKAGAFGQGGRRRPRPLGG